jgi:MFS superfamily sulfate permease-like transporter
MNLFSNLKQDMPASLVVFFVALPLCLGIALASGAPLFSGLVAGVVGGGVVGLLSASPLGVSGPAAGLAVIVLTAIDELGSFEVFLCSVVLAGVLQIVLGVARAGVLGYFFPNSVIKGMLAGIGIIIILKQLPHLVGYDADPIGDLDFRQADGNTTLSALGSMMQHVESSALWLGLGSLALLSVWDRWIKPRASALRLVPAALAAVVGGIACQALAMHFAPGLALAASHLVAVPVADGWQGFFALFTHPDWSRIADPAVLSTAATLAVIASLETLLCVEATDKLDPQKRVTPTNRELVAQGSGNMISGLLGGLPVTQVIVRSSANIQAGAKSRLSTVLHGALLLVCIALVPKVLNLIPLAVLAAVLIVVGYKLAQPALFRSMYALGATQFVPFVVTVGGVVLTDLLTGIAAGMTVALLFLLRRSYLNSHFLHIERRDTPDRQQTVTLRLAEEVTFLNKGAILKELSGITNGSHVVIDLRNCVSVDQDVREIIDDFRSSAGARAISVHVIRRETDDLNTAGRQSDVRAA